MLHFQWRTSWAVRKGDWKLIGAKGRKPDSKVKLSLYNLADEKPEAKDYADEKPARVAELLELHEEWIKEVTP